MLNQFFIAQLYAFLLIFMRMGSAVMILPGFGEAYIASRFRLLFAVMLSVVLVPLLANKLPAMPDSPAALLSLIIAEMVVGVFIGTISRIMINSLQSAATVISTQMSLTSAIVSDITLQAGQTSVVSNFLGVTALVCIFASDLHHVMIQGLVASYGVFAPGVFPMIGDMTQVVVNTVSSSLVIAMQISAPHLVVGTILFLAGGVLGRLMPSIQVFFLIMAPQIMIGFFILMTTISAMMLWFLEYFRDGITGVTGL